MAEHVKLVNDVEIGRAVRDLRAFQYRAVMIDVNGRVDLHTANGSAAPWIMVNNPNSGDNVSAANVPSWVKAVAGAAIVQGNWAVVTGSGGFLGVGSEASLLRVGIAMPLVGTNVGSGDTFTCALRG